MKPQEPENAGCGTGCGCLMFIELLEKPVK